MAKLNTTLIVQGATLIALSFPLSGCKEKGALAQLPASPTTASERRVRTVTVAHTLDRDQIRATGTTESLSTTKIMPLVPGTIRSIPVKAGDMVKKGQVLAVLDQRGYKLGLRRASAAIESVKVMLDATTREKARFEKLWKQKAINRSQYDLVLDKYKGAKAGHKQALVGLDMARKALADSVLRSPYDGLVYKKLASVGDFAASMPPTVLVMLKEIHTLELKVSLPEPELLRVKEGSEVEARFLSIERTVKAKVARIIRNVDPMTRSFVAIVEIANTDFSLEPGLYARVTIKTSKPRRRLLVPEEAVVDEGSGIYSVFLVQQDSAKRKVVGVNSAGAGKTEILSGLEGGEVLIIDSSGLLDGDPVKVRSKASGVKANKQRAEG